MASAIDKVKGDFGRFGESAKNLGKNFQNAFEHTFSNTKGIDGAKGFAGKAGNGIMTVITQPVRWVVKGATIPVKAASFLYRKFPVLTVGATIAGAAVGVNAFVKHRRQKATERELQAQLQMEQDMYAAQMEAQQQAPMAQANTYQVPQQGYGQPQQVPEATPYQNQVTPAEYAAMEARMRGNGAPTTGHADSVLAARQQSTPVQGAAI